MLGKILIYGSVIIAALATVAPDLGVPFALVLVVLGLVSGFVAPITDVTTRIAYRGFNLDHFSSHIPKI